ncbi:ABC transporter substrate-binding protein [Microvirga lotononidis]|uniref:ABC-type dipeptide transport system, periplasmic component n=1 Tax=Microvirga lotononidis TaxID=864069 RepID=I4Z1B7_9HYPH|nr:ABC transporter substrate-binding protein [Microvirga lotononidis]EIM30009.1 ABC-type dipeptide transport system, periplasmic component [Microvirga lotononidis]WQO31941.1 ABC transporter substrate-binding protein [Microvirga lotononidis]
MKQKIISVTTSLALGALMASTALAQEKTLTVAVANTVNTFDPHMTASVGTDLSLLSHIYPSLVLRGPDMKIQPAVATEWRNVDDLTWRIKLRSDASFADGEKIDAELVKWNFDRVRDPAVNARIKAWFTLISDVKVVSPTELEIKTSAPYPALIEQLSMFFLLPPKWAGEHKPGNETTSGGPYKITSVKPGESITLEVNEKYWGQKPDFAKYTIRVIPDAASRVAALLAGEVDFINSIPTTEIERIKATGNAQAGAVPSTRTVFIKFNTQKAPLDNKLFRQALNYAVDKEGIVKAIFNDQAEIARCEVMSKAYFGFNPDLKPYPYDPDKAAELLEKAGGAPSQPIELEVPSGTYLNGEEVVQAVASQLEEIGVKTRIVEMQFSNWMDKYLKTKDLGRLSLLSQAWPTIDADGLLTLFEPGNMYAYWDNAEFGRLLKEGRSTMDQAKRLATYKKATEVMCDEAPVLFLYTQPTTYGLSRRITWAARGDDWVRAFDMKPAN